MAGQEGRLAQLTMPCPTFLFIGGDRCGSKSLHNMFLQHPDAYVPPIADPYFFDKNYHRGLDWYLGLFKDAPPEARAIGELSHDYIHSPEAAERIYKDLPGVKIMMTLRHPVERTFSSYASAFSAGVFKVPFEQALEEAPMLISNSLYADKLDVYRQYFPIETMKVLLFDDLEGDPAEFGKSAFEFVGLRFIPDLDYGKRVSQLQASRFPLSGWASKQAANVMRKLGWVQLLGRVKHNPRIRNLFYKPYNAADKPQIAPETRKRLLERFKPQVDRLEKMLGKDLSAWRY